MIYSRNLPEQFHHIENNSESSSRPNEIIISSVVVIGFLFGTILFVFFCWLFCLCQARRRTIAIFTIESAQDTRKSKSKRQMEYDTRFYLGWMPKRAKHRPMVHSQKRCSFNPCWFTVCCCCCQEIKQGQFFLDEHSSYTLKQAPLDVSTGRLTFPISPIPQQRKLSILCPDEIVLPCIGHTPLSVPPSHHVASVNFYNYKLNGLDDDKIVY